jgi:hypothetical protein
MADSSFLVDVVRDVSAVRNTAAVSMETRVREKNLQQIVSFWSSNW